MKLQQQTERELSDRREKNYRVFNKQQQYQNFFEREKKKRMKRTEVLLEANNLLFCCLLTNLKDFCSHFCIETYLCNMYIAFPILKKNLRKSLKNQVCLSIQCIVLQGITNYSTTLLKNPAV